MSLAGSGVRFGSLSDAACEGPAKFRAMAHVARPTPTAAAPTMPMRGAVLFRLNSISITCGTRRPPSHGAEPERGPWIVLRSLKVGMRIGEGAGKLVVRGDVARRRRRCGDGTQVDVRLDVDFNVVGTQEDGAPGGPAGTAAGRPTAPDGHAPTNSAAVRATLFARRRMLARWWISPGSRALRTHERCATEPDERRGRERCGVKYHRLRGTP